ncbi:hypothetical protein [Pseudomonas putida]
MNDLRIKVIGLCVSTLVLAVVFMYVIQFGYHFSTEHDDWGTFGDYFGGVLNPLVAVFGFLGVLHSLHLQRQQLSQLVVDRKGEEVLAAIKDLDAQISERLKISIGFSFSAIGEKVELNIAHMVSEAT